MLTQLKKNCTVNIKSNRLMSCLSLSTVSILIISSIVVITIINVTPIIILGLGQLQNGQRDLILTPRLDYINTTKVKEYANQPIMPRLETNLFVDGREAAKGWFMDFTLERQMHLGTIAGFQGLNHNFIYANSDLGLSVGQNISIGLLDKSFLVAIKKSILSGNLYAQNSANVATQLGKLINDSTLISGNFIVKQNFATASGKFGIGQISKFIYVDINYALRQMIENTYRNLGKSLSQSALIKFINSPYFRLGDFASEATVNLPNRVDVYSDPDYDKTHTYLGHFGESFMKKIGIFSIKTAMPIAQHLIELGYLGMFIGVTLKLIIVSLFSLSVIMMNNMLSMGVERKNFDFALLKVMGANRMFVVINLLTSSLKYVLLANIIAYPLAYQALVSVTDVFQSFFGYKYDMRPTFSAIMGGLIIGVLVPIISALAPIWGVISNDLVQNLNPIRNKTQAIKTQVYIQGKEFPFGKLAFGLLSTSYGLMIYYLLPKSLINQNIGLLLIIFFIILQGLLLGLIFFSYSFQYFLQQIIAYITLFWIDKTDFILTLKNLSSHRFTNRRSSILYALSVSFIIFVSVGLQIQVQTIYNELLKYHGSYVEIISKNSQIDRQFYNSKLSKIDGVEDWAYISAPLSQVMREEGVKEIMISDKAKLFFATNQILAVSPNLINTFFFDRVSVFKTDSAYPYDPYSYLYSEEGFMSCTLSKYIAQRFGIIDSQNHEFYINYYYENKVRRTVLNYSSIFDKRIGLLYGSVSSRSQIGVSFDTFKTLANLPSNEDIPLNKIKIKITNPSESNQIANRIRAATYNASIVSTVWEYSQLKTTIEKIDNIINTVITILLVVVLVICFFSLITTTYVNVLNQTNEIGILMILGYEKFRIIKIFIYECFVLVVSSCIIGVGVGFFVAWMMGLQRQLFSDLPVSINVKGLDIIIISAILSSILSTYKPLREVFGNTISQIMNYAK